MRGLERRRRHDAVEPLLSEQPARQRACGRQPGDRAVIGNEELRDDRRRRDVLDGLLAGRGQRRSAQSSPEPVGPDEVVRSMDMLFLVFGRRAEGGGGHDLHLEAARRRYFDIASQRFAPTLGSGG